MVISSFFYFGDLNNGEKADITLIDSFRAFNEVKESNTVSSKTNAKSKIRKSNAISVQGKCSCSLLSDYGTHSEKWVNYCPQCHKYGTLRFTRGGGCPEGMLYCTSCDADFCAVHGKEHVYSRSTYLRHA